MPPETLPVLLAVLAVSLLSVVGAVVLLTGERLKRILPLRVALAAGALIGDTFLHLLPHAVEAEGGFTPAIAGGVLGGLLGFFLIESVLHWHHHGEDVHEHTPEGLHSFGWMNLLGDMLHNTIDGMLIASAWLASPEAGLATAIAVALHEIPQEFGDFGVLLHAGWSPRGAILANLCCAATALLGAALVLLAHGDLGVGPFLLPVAAGGFLYVACADLVPEVRKRVRGWQFVTTWAALLAGLGMMVLLHEIELVGHAHGPDHVHERPDGAGPPAHDDHDHDHHEEHGDPDTPR
jgi:zinc and cadmium transporter